MADELNIPTHRWYEARNHIKLPPNTVSKKWIYANGVALIDAWINSQPWGNLSTELFANGEPGFTFEPWDITTLYQDRAGTMPVTAAGQSVGLRLSKDQGLRQGPELVTNGSNEAGVAVAPLDTLTNFTSKVQSADRAQSGTYSAKLTANSTSGSHYWNLTNVSAGVTVQISGWVYVPTGATAGQAIKLVDIFDGSFVPEIVPNAGKYDQWVYFSAIRPAKASAWALALGQDTAANWAGGSIYVDGLSIKTLAGNHEVAVSDAKRGVYGWMPKTGRRNLLTYTEQFDNAVWVKGELTVSTNAAVAPDGTTTADKLVESVNNAGRGTYYNPTSSTAVALSQNVTFTTYLKAAERGFGGMTAVDGGNNRYYLVANLSTGAEIASGFANGSTTVVSKSITNVGEGWYRLQVTLTSGGAGNAFMWGYPQDDATFSTSTTGNAIYQGNGTSGIYIWGAQLETGSTATAYQRVVSQYDITEAGVPTCYYVQADGVDDAYVTPTITPNTDKVQVFAGVRKLGNGMHIEHSASADANNGAFYRYAGEVAAGDLSVGLRGTQLTKLISAGAAIPVNRVETSLLDIAAATRETEILLRINGASVSGGAFGAADAGTGNFLAYPAYIYSRGGTTFPFNGLDFGHAVRFGPNLDAATIARVESLIARNTPEVTL